MYINFCKLHHVRFPGNSLFVCGHIYSKVNSKFLELSLNIYIKKSVQNTSCSKKQKTFNVQHTTTVNQTVSNIIKRNQEDFYTGPVR
jgi:NurA-like 5'-3' nuclease